MPASAGTSSASFRRFAPDRLRAGVRPCGPSVGGPDHRLRAWDALMSAALATARPPGRPKAPGPRAWPGGRN